MRDSEQTHSLTFAMMHGRSHDSWCWNYVAKELGKAGHEIVAPDLPIEDENATFAAYGLYVAEAIGDRKDVVLVAHSRAGHVVPWVGRYASLRTVIYLCASLPYTTRQLADSEDEPEKYQPGYENIIIAHSNGYTEYDKSGAQEYLYNGCPSERVALAINHLRPHNTNDSEVPLVEQHPVVPTHSLYGQLDRVIRPEYSEYRAQKSLGKAAICIDGWGHSPFLSHPYELSQKLIEFALKE